jgi:hypothetical protein
LETTFVIRRIVAEPVLARSREIETTPASIKASPDTSPEVIFDRANSAHGLSGEQSRQDRTQ